MSYILFFGLFYISIPAIITLYTKSSMFGASLHAITYAGEVGLYFIIVFLLAFIVSLSIKSSHNNIKISKQINIRIFILTLSYMIIFYIFLILLSNFELLLNIYGSRRLQADFEFILINTYKIAFLSKIMIIFICYLYFTNKKINYIFLFLPFVLIDFLLSGRSLILVFGLLYLLLYAFDKKKINIKYLFLFIIFGMFIGILRNGNIDLSKFIDAFAEFIITFSTSHLLIDDIYENNIGDSFNYLLSKMFFPGTYSILNGENYTSYKVTMSLLNPYSDRMGLGGGLITEAISFKNELLIFIFPLIIVLYSFIVNIFLIRDIVFLRVIAILAIIQVHAIFRGSFFEVALYPVYLGLFYGFWIFALDVVGRKKYEK